MELEQEESGLVAPLVAQALMEEVDEMRFVGKSDGMGEAAGVAEYGSELGNSTVDAVMHFGPVTEPTELESELVTVRLLVHHITSTKLTKLCSRLR